MKRYIIAAIVLAALCSATVLQQRRISALTSERNKYQSNTDALLTDVRTWKVRDSLNAARVLSLELTAREYERYRAEDLQLIKELTARNRDLAAVAKTQSETIIEMRSVPRDTVVIVDSIRVPAVAVHAGDRWFDFDGVLTEKEFSGVLRNRDSLLMAETVKYGRFLFWRTKRIKNRDVSVVSKNPYTKILGVEHIVIEKQ